MKRFKVISIHFTTECNMKPRCPFCYRNKNTDKRKEKSLNFWYKLIPYLTELTEQIAVGGGETFTNLEFIKKFSKKCKNKGLLCNVTTNGRLLMKLTDRQLKEVLKNITMVSISYDNHKVQNITDLMNYIKLVKRIKKLTKTQVGSNLLINNDMFKDNGLTFIKVVDGLFKMGCDRVFALSIKNCVCPDILKYKKAYIYLTLKFKHFYIDDLTRMVLEKGYSNWNTPCHYGKDLISIDECGNVCGCSFDNPEKALLKLNKPKDILNILKIKAEKRFNCPYLSKKKQMSELWTRNIRTNLVWN